MTTATQIVMIYDADKLGAPVTALLKQFCWDRTPFGRFEVKAQRYRKNANALAAGFDRMPLDQATAFMSSNRYTQTTLDSAIRNYGKKVLKGDDTTTHRKGMRRLHIQLLRGIEKAFLEDKGGVLPVDRIQASASRMVKITPERMSQAERSERTLWEVEFHQVLVYLPTEESALAERRKAVGDDSDPIVDLSDPIHIQAQRAGFGGLHSRSGACAIQQYGSMLGEVASGESNPPSLPWSVLTTYVVRPDGTKAFVHCLVTCAASSAVPGVWQRIARCKVYRRITGRMLSITLTPPGYDGILARVSSQSLQPSRRKPKRRRHRSAKLRCLKATATALALGKMLFQHAKQYGGDRLRRDAHQIVTAQQGYTHIASQAGIAGCSTSRLLHALFELGKVCPRSCFEVQRHAHLLSSGELCTSDYYGGIACRHAEVVRGRFFNSEARYSPFIDCRASSAEEECGEEAYVERPTPNYHSYQYRLTPDENAASHSLSFGYNS